MAKKQPVDWGKAIQPLLKVYKNRKHPLDYKNGYELLVGIVLSAQDSDAHINKVTPPLFEQYPNMESLSNATMERLLPLLNHVRGHRKKIQWLISIAKEVKTDNNIPTTMAKLVKLKGIGRKSANVFKREMGAEAEGVMVDLHVVRVAERLGITDAADPKKIEMDIMNAVPPKDWSEVGMAISFLGREIYRPTNPKHSECLMRDVCRYYDEVGKKMPQLKKPEKSKTIKASTLNKDPDLYVRTKKAKPAKKAAVKKAAAKKKSRK